MATKVVSRPGPRAFREAAKAASKAVTATVETSRKLSQAEQVLLDGVRQLRLESQKAEQAIETWLFSGNRVDAENDFDAYVDRLKEIKQLTWNAFCDVYRLTEYGNIDKPNQ